MSEQVSRLGKCFTTPRIYIGCNQSTDTRYFSCKYFCGRVSLSNMGPLLLFVGTESQKSLLWSQRALMQTLSSLSAMERGIKKPIKETRNPLQVWKKITTYLNNAPENVKSWILWCLETVYHHRSYTTTSAGNNGDLSRDNVFRFWYCSKF